jgi:hypothetical protein
MSKIHFASLLTTAFTGLVVAQTTQTFSYTGSMQTFTVPGCVTQVTLTAHGARGGPNAGGVNGGNGGSAGGVLAVNPGDILYIFAGGTNGYNGGGLAGVSACTSAIGGCGGGASDVRINGNGLSNRVLVAGGGGGAGGNRVMGCGRGNGGGGGGGYFGGGGGAAWPGTQNFNVSLLSKGGTQTAGGAGGISLYTNTLIPNNSGTSGILAIGGNGGIEMASGQATNNTAASGGAGGGLVGLDGMYSGGTTTVVSETQTLVIGNNFTGMSGAGGSSYVAPLSLAWTFTGTNQSVGFVTVTYIPPQGTLTINQSAQALCAGTSATITATGQPTYTWSTGSTNSMIVVSPTITTSYIVTSSVLTGCVYHATATVQVDGNVPAITINTGSLNACPGKHVTLIASGASSYTWSGGIVNGQSFIPTSPQTYTVMASNNCGTSTATAQVTLLNSPVITTSATSATVCAGNAVTLFAGGANTYTWSSGYGNGQSFVPSVTSSYTVTGMGVNGCTATAVSMVTVVAFSGSSVQVTPAQQTVCAGNTLSLSASGAVTYSWQNGQQTPGIVLSPSTNAVYAVSGTNSSGCISTAFANVSVDSQPTVQLTASTFSLCSGQPVVITASGASTYTLSGNISNGQIQFPSATTVYTVSGTNACGTSTAAATVTVYPIPAIGIVASSHTLCAGNNIILNGSGGTGYSWSGGILNGVAFQPASSSNYTVSGTSVHGCTANAVAQVTVYPVPNNPPMATAATVCAGSTSTLLASGALSYTWLPLNNYSASITVTPGSTTTYTLLQANLHCGSSMTLAVGVFPLPPVLVSASPATVCAGNSAQLTASGANQYTWSPGGVQGTTINPSPSTSQIYTVTGSDGNCANTATLQLNVLQLPTVLLSSSAPSVCAGQSVQVQAGGASTYLWQPPLLTGTGGITTPGTSIVYSVTGTDTNGCSAIASVAVIVHTVPVLSISMGQTMVCKGDVAQVASAGAASYTWNTGSNSPTLTATMQAPFTFTLNGASAAGCISSATAFINVFSPLMSVSGPSSVCAGLAAQLLASGATSYLWNNSHPFAAITVTPASYTIYQVTGTSYSNNLACVSLQTIGVGVIPNPVVTASAAKDRICRNESIQLFASGATQYTWQPTGTQAASLQTAPAVMTIYTLTGIHNGCSGSATIKIPVDQCTGTDADLLSSSGFRFYPNPSSDVLFIVSTKPMRLELINAIGQLAGVIELPGNQEPCSISGLAEGVYFIRDKHTGFAARLVVNN